MKNANTIINIFLCICASAAAGATGMFFYQKNHKAENDKSLVEECYDYLKENGVEFPKDKDVSEAALKGLIASYDDEYMYYIKAVSEDESYLNSLNTFPAYVSSGYTVGLNDNGQLIIKTVNPDSTAMDQGFRENDVIIAVDDVTVENDGLRKTAFELSGKDGTVMHVVLERNGKRIELDFKRRNDGYAGTDNVDSRLIGDTLYLSIKRFEVHTAQQVKENLDKYDSYDSLVLDLRENLGGDTQESVSTVNYFIGNSTTTMYYYTGKTDKYETFNDPDDISVKTVILVNENTASAAEICTSLLKQYAGDVTVVGTNTYGKGVFQKEKVLSNGGTVHYTAGYYTVGDWECYQDKGIKPDVEVEMDKTLIGTDDDVQLNKALELLA